MAKSVQINVKINTQEGVKSIGDLNEEVKTTITTLGEMEDAADLLSEKLREVEVGTEEYEKLRKELIKVNTEIKNQELAMEALDNEQVASEIKSVVGGLTDMAGGLALVGASSGSIEKIVQTFAKVEGISKIATGAIEGYQSAMKLSGTITNALAAAQVFLGNAMAAGGAKAKIAAVGMRVLNVVMNANPVLLIVTGITALIGAFVLFSSSSEDAAKSAEKLNTALDKQLRALQNLDKQQRISSQNNQRLEAAHRDDTQANLEFQIESLELIQNRTEEQNKSLEYFRQRLVKANREAIFQEQEDALSNFDTERKLKQKELTLLSETIDEEAKILKKLTGDEKAELFERRNNRIVEYNSMLAEYNGAANERFAIEIEFTNKLKALDNERTLESIREEKERNDKIRQQQQKLAEQIRNIKQKIELALIEDQEEREIRAVEIRGENELAGVKGNSEKAKQLRELIEVQSAIDISKIREKFRNQELTKDKEAADEAAKARIDAENSALNELEAASEEIFQNSLNEQQREIIAVQDKYFRLIELAKEYGEDTIDLEKERNRQIKEINDKYAEDNSNTRTGQINSWLQENSVAISMIQGFATQSVNLIGQVIEESAARAAAARQAEYDSETESFNSQLANREINQEQFDAKMRALDQRREREELAAKKRAFKQSKALQVTNAVMSTAAAVLNAFSSAAAIPIAGVALGPIMAGVAGALGAAQIGIISSQQFRAARGGVVPGNGPSNIDSVDALLAPGEMVINSQSASMFPQTLSSINQAGGGIPLAPSPLPAQNLSSDPVFGDNQRSQEVRAYVVETDVTDKQRRVVRYEDSATFG